MANGKIMIEAIPGMRVAELTSTAAGFDPVHIGPVVRPLFDELVVRLERDGVEPAGPAVAYYERTPIGGQVVVHAAMPVADGVRTGTDFAVLHLPSVPRAATLEYRGSMDDVLPAWHSLDAWIESNGYRADGPARERYVVYADDPADRVTELQQPVTRV